MPGSVPVINGVNYSWANISLILFGTPVIGITAIDYKRKQEKKNNYGAGQQPVSRGYGNYEYEGSIELYMDVWKQIISSSPNRDPLLIPMFDIPVVYGGTGVLTTKDVLRGCEFTEEGLDTKSGDTRILIKIPLIIGSIDR
jgi:hypothetical protein